MPSLETWQAVCDGLAAVAGIGAVFIAIAAWKTAAQTFRRDHRPIVRVVQTVAPPLVTGHEPDAATMRLDVILLKNIGRGPALGIVIYDPRHKSVIGGAPVAEPLGSADLQPTRPGRRGVSLRVPMTMNSAYELYSQDVLGAWHLTSFRPVPFHIECSFAEVKARHVPAAVRVLATVATP